MFKQPGKAAGTLEIPQLVRLQRPEYVTELFHRFLDDQASHRLAPYDAALGLLQILSEVGRAPLSATEASGNSLVGRAEAHIIRHMAEPLSTARLARVLRINPDYLNRAFRKVHGMTITEYLHRRKLQDAAMLLRESTDSIAEIASACGYGTPVHFRRMFQRFNGVTPRDYRRLHARAFVNAR